MRIKENHKLENIANEDVIIIDVENSTPKVITFNPTSTFIWNKLQGREFTTESVIEIILTHYEIDVNTAVIDAEKWVYMLEKNNLIEK